MIYVHFLDSSLETLHFSIDETKRRARLECSFKGQIHWLSIIVWFNSSHSHSDVRVAASHSPRSIDCAAESSRVSRVFANVFFSQLRLSEMCSPHEYSSYKDKFNISYYFFNISSYWKSTAKIFSSFSELFSSLISIVSFVVCWVPFVNLRGESSSGRELVSFSEKPFCSHRDDFSLRPIEPCNSVRSTCKRNIGYWIETFSPFFAQSTLLQ